MNFKERFQGRMAVIKKQGIDELISSGGIPIKDSSPVFHTKRNQNLETNVGVSGNFTDQWNSMRHMSNNSHSSNFVTLNPRDPNLIGTSNSPPRRSMGVNHILQNNTSFQAKQTLTMDFNNSRLGEGKIASLKPRSHNGSLFLYPQNDLSNSLGYVRNIEASISHHGRTPSVSRNSSLRKDPLPINGNMVLLRSSHDGMDSLDYMRNHKNSSPVNQGVYSNLISSRESFQESLHNMGILKPTPVSIHTIERENPKRISFTRVPRTINEQMISSNRYRNESHLLMEHMANPILRSNEIIPDSQRSILKDFQVRSRKASPVSFNEIKSPSPIRLVRIEQQPLTNPPNYNFSREIPRMTDTLARTRKPYQRVRVASAQYPSLTHLKEDYES